MTKTEFIQGGGYPPPWHPNYKEIFLEALAPIPIRIGPTYIRLKLPTHHPAFMTFKHLLNHKASTWGFDPRFRRSYLEATFYSFNEQQGILRLPRGYLELVKGTLRECRVLMDIQEDPVIIPRKVDIRLAGTKTVRPEQVGPIDFLSRDETSMKGLEIQTGVGKSFMAINVMANLGYASMVICSGLVDQWMQMIKDNTRVEDLYVIKAFSSIADLVKSDYYPTIMICSLETLRLYSQCAPGYRELPYSYDGFLEHYGIGTKIVDEVHENYQAVAIMDLFSRVRNNIYMSATFRRSRDAENKIFNIIYPLHIRYGGVAYVKYTKLTFYAYVSGVPEQKTITQRGYNQARFEAYLMRRPTKLETFFRSVIFVCIDVHYLRLRHHMQKCLIYVNTIQMAQVTQKAIQAHYPKLVVTTYISDDPEENYADGVDVIVSIPMKSATGRDISNLRTVINVVSTASSVLLEQMFGRLRKIPGVVTEYVSIFDEGNRAQIRHHEAQVEVLGPRAISMNTHHLY